MQSSGELHHRYGEPNLERFQVRPGIDLTVEYGSDHLACKMTIQPSQSPSQQENQKPRMSSEIVSDILEEVAPVAKRGAVIERGSFQASCAGGYVTDYENVTIDRGFAECEMSNPNHDSGTQIFFKRAACTKPNQTLVVPSPKSR